MAYQPELEKLERRYQEDPGRNFAQLAESYRKLGRLDDALDVLRAHLTDRPNYVSGLVVLGRCLLDQQNDGEARETFERVLAVDAEHIIALKALGEIAERAQEIEPARAWYQRLLDIDPMNDDAAAALGRLPAKGAAPAAAEDTASPIAEQEAAAPPAGPAASGWAGAANRAGAESAGPAGAGADTGAPPPPEAPPGRGEAGPQGVAPSWIEPYAGPGEQPPPEAAPAGSEAGAAGWADFLGGLSEAPPQEPAAPPSLRADAPPEVDVVRAGWAEPVERPAAPLPPEDSGLPASAAADGPNETPATVHEGITPAAGGEVGASEFADDVTIERASTEYMAETEAAKLEPMAIERSGEFDAGVEQPFEPPVGAELPVNLGEPAAESGVAETGAPAEPEAPTPSAVAPEESPWFEAEDEAEAIELQAPASGSDADELVIEPFDESLGWDAGDRVSRQISSADLADAEQVHEESLEVPVQEILEPTEAVLPDEAEIEELKTARVNGLETAPSAPADVAPVEGLQTTELGVAPLAEEHAVASAPEQPAEPEEATVPETDAGEVVPPEAEPQEADRRASLAGLPVFMPDDTEEPTEPLVVDAEPEPVVTETMAELYARQGLVTEARDVYRQLLETRPGDARLGARLAELEAPARPLAQPTIRYLAAESGGQRVRDYLADVLAARSSVAAVEPAPASGPDGRDLTDAEASSAGPEPMEVAFEEESAEIQGAPTQPAADEVSLAAIFGEASPTPPPAASPPESARAEPERAPGGFSFDEFFAKGAPGDAAERGRGSRETLADDEGDDAFRDWLKSLKS